MDITGIINLILKKWWLVLGVPALAAGLTFAVVRSQPKTYKSTAQLSTGFTMENTLALKDEKMDLRGIGIKFDNLIQTMKSERVISMVSYNLELNDLESTYPFRPDPEGEYLEEEIMLKVLDEHISAMEMLDPTDPEENLIFERIKAKNYHPWMLIGNLSVRRVKNTDFISVQYSSENPDLSAFVVNQVCEQIIKYVELFNQDRSSESLSFFYDLIQEKKKNLDEKIAQLNTFKSTNSVVDYEIQSESIVSQISGYEINRQEELKNIQRLTLSINKLNSDILELRQESTSNPNNAKIVELRKKINDLNQLYIEGGSTDTQLYQTIQNLRERLRIEMTSLASQSPVRSSVNISDLQYQKEQQELELSIAESNLSSLNRSINNLKANLSAFSNKESLIAALEEEVENAKKEHLQALSKYNEKKSESLASGAGIKQILEGVPASTPESSKTFLLVILAGVASMGLTCFAIVLLEFTDLRIKNIKQFEKYTKLRPLGSVNAIKMANVDLKRIFTSDNQDEELLVFKQSLRKIRFEVEQSPNTKTVLVTSTKQGEGKSFLILCLAYSLSLIKKRILIIDTNFKNNSLTELLLAPASMDKLLEANNGMSARLLPAGDAGMGSDDDFVKNIISRTGHENIDVIGSSVGTSSPSEIFSGRDFRNMLDIVSMNYDYVFMEGPSLNKYPDTKELLAYVDKVIPVFSADSVIKQVDSESIDFLKTLNGKFLGAILNNVETKLMVTK